MKKNSGQCLCGSVVFSIFSELREVIFCHCGQCLKTHGHFSAYTETSEKNIEWGATSSLSWYQSSPKAQRGFCKNCGASLFYKLDESDQISVSAGCLEKPTKLRPSCHIYVKDTSDYYEITDHLPTYEADID
mgnify:CR=1 FL=1